MISKLFSKITGIDKSILKIIRLIIKISFIICAISSLILCIYISNPVSSTTYLLGLKLFKAGLAYAVASIICGLSIDTLIKGFI